MDLALESPRFGVHNPACASPSDLHPRRGSIMVLTPALAVGEEALPLLLGETDHSNNLQLPLYFTGYPDWRRFLVHQGTVHFAVVRSDSILGTQLLPEPQWARNETS